MTDERAFQRWADSKRIFLEMVRLPIEERSRAMALACGADDALRAEVAALLARDAEWPNESGPGVGAPRLVAPEPQEFGSYVRIGLLGEGASAIVYLARDRAQGSEVAVKVLRPGVASPTALRRFQLEPEMMARLEHPGIARVLSVGVLPPPDGRPYFVLEHVPGSHLLAYADEHHLDEKARIHLFLAVCDAVHHAHARGVLHRDIKPANIIVDADGHPKVLDFGVARLLDPAGQRATLATVLTQVVGTLHYMAPEQFDVAASPSTLTDVYSLGAVLHELLTGRPPHDLAGLSFPEAIQRIRASDPPGIASLRPACRGDLATVVHKALDRDPDRRYASAAELASDLRHVLANEPIVGRSPSRWYEIKKLVARHRILLACSLLIFASGIAMLVWALNSRAAARRNYLAIRDTSLVILGAGMERLRPTFETFEVRQALLDQLESSVERLAAENRSDPAIQLAQARLWGARADMEHEAGRGEATLPLRQRVEEAYQTLVRSGFATAEVRSEHSIAIVKIGDLFADKRQRVEALPYYTRALEIDRELVRECPDDLHLRDNLCWSVERVAMNALGRGQTEEAAEIAERLDAEITTLLGMSPDRPGSLFMAARAASLRGALASRTGNTREEQRSAFAAVDIGRRLVSLAPSNRDYLRRHAMDCVWSARTCRGDETRWGEVTSLLESARGMLKSVHGGAPDSAMAAQDWGDYYAEEVWWHDQRGEVELAREASLECERCLRISLAHDIGNANLTYSLSYVLGVRAKGLELCGRIAEARTAMIESLELLEARAGSDDATPEDLLALAGTLAACPVLELRDPDRVVDIAAQMAGVPDPLQAATAQIAAGKALVADGRSTEAWNLLASALASVPADQPDIRSLVSKAAAELGLPEFDPQQPR